MLIRVVIIQLIQLILRKATVIQLVTEVHQGLLPFVEAMAEQLRFYFIQLSVFTLVIFIFARAFYDATYFVPFYRANGIFYVWILNCRACGQLPHHAKRPK